MTTTLIAGETADDLAEAFSHFRVRPGLDGMVEVNAEMEPGVALPLRRALMRVEAELLAQDADGLGAEATVTERTDAQRRADALAELIHRATAAMDESPPETA